MTILKAYRSVGFAWKGLTITWKEQHNFRIAVVATLIVLFCIFFFHFSYVESALCIIAITMVLGSEIINTAVEDLCNRIEKNHDIHIGKIKDTSAAYVFVSVIGAFIIGMIVFCHHFLL